MGRLTGCCCCFDLREGSRAIGITLIVLTTLGLVLQIGHATMPSDQIESSDGAQHAKKTVHTVLRIIFSFLHIGFNALLVRGVEQKRRGLIKAWLIYFGIINGITSILMVVSFVFSCMSGIWWLPLLVLGLAGLVGVFWYWFVVVLQFHEELREEDGFVYSKQQNDGEKHAL